MADLLTKVDDIETVDEALRDYYREENGAYFLNATTVGTLEVADTAALKNALTNERKAKEEAIKAFKPYEKYAEINLDAAIEAAARVEELTQGTVDQQAELERKLQSQADQLVTQHNEKLSAVEAEKVELQNAVKVMMIDNRATAEILKAEGDVENLLPHVTKRMEVIKSDKTKTGFDIQVLKTDGDPAIDGQANPVSVKDLVNSFREPFPFAFKGAGSSGGGGAGDDGPGSGGKKTVKRSEFDGWDDVKKKAFHHDKDGKPTGNKVID
jgi:DNA repair exonuclease SbcCD ATPase subunit